MYPCFQGGKKIEKQQIFIDIQRNIQSLQIQDGKKLDITVDTRYQSYGKIQMTVENSQKQLMYQIQAKQNISPPLSQKVISQQFCQKHKYFPNLIQDNFYLNGQSQNQVQVSLANKKVCHSLQENQASCIDELTTDTNKTLQKQCSKLNRLKQLSSLQIKAISKQLKKITKSLKNQINIDSPLIQDCARLTIQNRDRNLGRQNLEILNKLAAKCKLSFEQICAKYYKIREIQDHKFFSQAGNQQSTFLEKFNITSIVQFEQKEWQKIDQNLLQKLRKIGYILGLKQRNSPTTQRLYCFSYQAAYKIQELLREKGINPKKPIIQLQLQQNCQKDKQSLYIRYEAIQQITLQRLTFNNTLQKLAHILDQLWLVDKVCGILLQNSKITINFINSVNSQNVMEAHYKFSKLGNYSSKDFKPSFLKLQ